LVLFTELIVRRVENELFYVTEHLGMKDCLKRIAGWSQRSLHWPWRWIN